MHYKYRWLYALVGSISILTTGFFYFIQPDLTKLAKVKLTRERLLKETAMMQWRAKQKTPVKRASAPGVSLGQTDMASMPYPALLALIQASGLMVRQITALSWQVVQGVDAEKRHIVLEGHFQQTAFLISTLAKQEKPVILADFSYKTAEKGRLVLSMDILLPKMNLGDFQEASSQREITYPLSNPFCLDDEASALSHDDSASRAKTLSIEQFNMVGYWQQGGRKQALLLLPTGALMAVERGVVLGKDQGVVTAVDQDHLTIVLPDHRQFSLKINQANDSKRG